MIPRGTSCGSDKERVAFVVRVEEQKRRYVAEAIVVGARECGKKTLRIPSVSVRARCKASAARAFVYHHVTHADSSYAYAAGAIGEDWLGIGPRPMDAVL